MWLVICECGYHIGGLDESTARAWADTHEDEHAACEPLVERELDQ